MGQKPRLVRKLLIVSYNIFKITANLKLLYLTEICFTSCEFQNFTEENYIKHIKIATESLQANGQVERINRDLIPLNKLSEPWYNFLTDTVCYKQYC